MGAESNAAPSSSNTTQGGFQSAPGEDFLDRDDEALRALKGQIVWPAVKLLVAGLGLRSPHDASRHKQLGRVSGGGGLASPAFSPQGIHADFRGLLCICARGAGTRGCLEFVNPNLNAVSIGNQPSGRLHRPETGQPHLFPPYYMHFVHPLKSDAPRHVIAFDVD